MAATSHQTTQGISRRSFIKSLTAAGVVTSGSSLFNIFVPKAYGDPVGDLPTANGMNMIVVITDQERALQWFPPNWAANNLPAFSSLQANGVTFNRAYTNSCMCTPARNCIFTGKFPAQHRSKDTLTEEFAQSEQEHQLDPNLPNLATALKSAGYEVVYKGKWHLSKPVKGADGTMQHDDITRYGFDGWNPPDAGQDVKIENFGGGYADHDTRYINDAIEYLKYKRDNPGGKPFCLVVSLVNPHDVLAFPGALGAETPDYIAGGYVNPEWLEGDIQLPPTVDENLLENVKPVAHRQMQLRLNGLGPLLTPEKQLQYLNFYGNLMKEVDGHLQSLLNVFSENEDGESLRSNTLVVRMADHGEMGMAHGGLRQKAFMCYEEAVRIPLIWSNPDLFPTGRVCDELVSHVDFLPTVCSLLGVPDWHTFEFSGVDYSTLLLDPEAGAVQDYVLFTYDDIYAGQNGDGAPDGIIDPPNRIHMVANKEFKYARYFDISGVEHDQQEFYDLRPFSEGNVDTYTGLDIYETHGGPLETRNLSIWAQGFRQAAPGMEPLVMTEAQETARGQMMQLLAEATDPVTGRIIPREVEAPIAAKDVTIRTVAVTDGETNETTDVIEIKFLSSWGTDYQLQKSTDLGDWVDVGEPIPGNNGPILIQEPLESDAMFYRVYSTVIEE